jgi:hypothetical protein
VPYPAGTNIITFVRLRGEHGLRTDVSPSEHPHAPASVVGVAAQTVDQGAEGRFERDGVAAGLAGWPRWSVRWRAGMR